ncbi:hypothetical protein CRG98_020126 [Punica granatum]|uniref:Uncharacterized protein n=1 Tax=Punica granatum TaxID=22663 RepID=A0A2I0JT64_PUNGR|nr:hypothetical protein CRG98_020126 [Punica granatum]
MRGAGPSADPRLLTTRLSSCIARRRAGDRRSVGVGSRRRVVERESEKVGGERKSKCRGGVCSVIPELVEVSFYKIPELASSSHSHA